MARKLRSTPLLRLMRRPYKSDPFNCRYDNGRSSGMSSHDKTPRSPTSDSRVHVHPMLRFALSKNFGISQLNQVQESAYMSMVSGKDTTIHAPAGLGKTLAYLLPLVNNIYHIHDMLEHLMTTRGSVGRHAAREKELKNTALAWSQRVPHASHQHEFEHLKQDECNLERQGDLMVKTTMEKLVHALAACRPHNLLNSGVTLPMLPNRIWRRKSINSIYRTLMKNPLGTVRCAVIVVPSKDLVAQVLNDIQTLDILGRVSVQTLTQVHQLPTDVSEAKVDVSQFYESQPFYPSLHATMALSGENRKILLSAEDEAVMLNNLPTVETRQEKVQLVNLHGRKTTTIMARAPLGDGVQQLQNYGVDGFVVDKVEHKRQPIVIHPNIQWGSVDLVVTTPLLLLNDLDSSLKHKRVPVCVVFDEIDTLLENNGSRMGVMALVSRIRPRPKIFNPLVHQFKRRANPMPPCQFIHVASTMNFGGPQTCGSMLAERFNCAHLITSGKEHMLNEANVHVVEIECTDCNDYSSRLGAFLKLLQVHGGAKVLVYMRSLQELWTLHAHLKEHNWPVMSIHSRSTLITRLAILKCLSNWDAGILLVTDVCTRGVRITNVDHIIHFDMPTDAATFLHRNKASQAQISCLVNLHKEPQVIEYIIQAASLTRNINRLLSRKRSLGRRLGHDMYTRNAEDTKAKQLNVNPHAHADEKAALAPVVLEKPASARFKSVDLKRRLQGVYATFTC